MGRFINKEFSLAEYPREVGLDFPINYDHSVPLERILVSSGGSNKLVESRLLGIPEVTGNCRQTCMAFFSESEQGVMRFPGFFTNGGSELDMSLDGSGKLMEFLTLKLNHLTGPNFASAMDQIIKQYPPDQRTAQLEQAMTYIPELGIERPID